MAVNTTVEVVMPAMGESVSEGTILEWHKQEGDAGRRGRDARRDLDRQGRRRGPRARLRHRGEDPRRRGRHRRRRRRARRDRARRNGAGPARRGADERRGRGADAEPAAEAKTDRHRRCPRWASRSPRARSSSGPSSPATRSRPTRRSSRSPPTRSTPRCPRPPRGTITEILAEAGDTVTVGQVIARMTAGAGGAEGRRHAGARADRAPRPRRRRRRRPHARGHRRSRPSRAASPPPHGVDLAQVKGTGPAGRIAKADVLGRRRATARPRAAAPAEDDARRCSRAPRAMLARYMDESRSIPTATSFRTLTVTTLDGRRKQLKDGRPARSPSRT